jgi:polyhydroxyalkanoate synthesis regulator phasin
MTGIVDADRFRMRSSARSTGGDDGGNMDDFLPRLGIVESAIAETREDVSAIKAALPHLATKADMNELKADVSAIKATLPHLATKADVVATKADINELRSDMSAMETRITRWIVATTIATASVAFTIAKFVK